MSTLASVIGLGLHTARPTAGIAGRLYYETDTTTLFRDNGATWESAEGSAAVADILDLNTVASNTALVLAPDGKGGVEFRSGAGGLADEGEFTYLDAVGASAPGNPASGSARIYAKTDGRIYSRDNAGTEYGPFDAAGGGAGGPLLYADSLPLGTYGTEFADDTGWTKVGSVTTAYTESDAYDDVLCTIVLPNIAHTDRLVRAAPAGDFTATLTVHGISKDDAMCGLIYANASGNGVGLEWRNSDWWWSTISGWNYGSVISYLTHVPTLPKWPNTVSPYKGSIFTIRIMRASDVMTAQASLDGGLTWCAVSGTIAAPTGTPYFAIGDSYSTGTTILLGRLTVSEP